MSQNIHSILVVDDNPTNRLLIKQQLGYLGYDVEVVSNGELALKKLASDKFDILMTDINMPVMDGYQLTQQIRAVSDDSISSIPIIAITADATGADEQRYLLAGMDGFMIKPIELGFLQNYLLDFQHEGKQATSKRSAPVKGNEHISDSKRGEEVNQDSSLFDISTVSDFVGGNMQMVQRLLNVFLEQTPETIEQIHTACLQDDIKNVVNGCHKLKSSARSVGANRLSDLCFEMEQAGENGQLADIKALDRLFDALFNETQAAIVSLDLG